jgi:hypothetical protein
VAIADDEFHGTGNLRNRWVWVADDGSPVCGTWRP